MLSVVLPRREGVEYDVDHAVHPEDGDIWLVRSNRGPAGEELENFALFELPVGERRPRLDAAPAPLPAGREDRVR